MVRELLVFIGGRLAGVAKRWTSSDTRRIAFRYDDAYISDPESTPLSLRLPLGDAEYEISNWLDGLLPDKESVRKKWAAQQKAQAPEPMSLLATPVGLDCAGAVQFCRPGEEEAVYDRDSGVEWHAAEEIADWARKAKQGQRHQLGSQLRHSLGGWQTKVALHRVGDEWGTPFGDQPTTWILKPGIDPRPDEGISWPNSDLIEHVTMAAARQLGLDAAHTTIEWFAGERVLAVRRYDRIQEHGRWLRTHQEDLCQALDVPPERKYQSDDGPSPGAILDLLRDESSDRAADITRFLDGLIFNWAIGGTDGHAKNYSVLLLGGQTNLAPLYDMMTEIPYWSGLEVTNLRTAMKVGEGYTLADADHPSVWALVAERFRLNPEQVVERAEYILDNCPDAVDAVVAALGPEDQKSPQIAALASGLQKRRNEAIDCFIGVSAHRRVGAQTQAHQPAPATAPEQPPSLPPDWEWSSTSKSTDPVICGAPIGVDRWCRRTLVSAPCPDHRHSSGSNKVRSRAKSQQAVTRKPPTGASAKKLASSRGNAKRRWWRKATTNRSDDSG